MNNENPGGHLGVVMGLMRKISNLNDLLATHIPRAFPVGMTVHWKHGYYLRSGVVDMHSTLRGSEVRVEPENGSVRWIEVSQLIECDTAHDDQEPTK